MTAYALGVEIACEGPACKVARGGSIEVADYLLEVEQSVYSRSADYHPATAREPRRVLALNGAALGGSNNGEARSDWGYKANVTVHAAVTGQGYAYGAVVAGCDGSVELSYEADASSHRVDAQLLCRRPGCRKRIEQELTKETRNPG